MVVMICVILYLVLWCQRTCDATGAQTDSTRQIHKTEAHTRTKHLRR